MLGSFTIVASRQFTSSRSIFAGQTVQLTTQQQHPTLLRDLLQVLDHVNLTKIHSQDANTLCTTEGIKFVIDFQADNDQNVVDVMESLKQFGMVNPLIPNDTPWFPRHIYDLDRIDQRTMEGGAELNADHPGFNDVQYKKRRHRIAEVAYNYKLQHGEIPNIEYTKKEDETWTAIWDKLEPLHLEYACDEFLEESEKCKKLGLMKRDRVPQLQDFNQYLMETTEFQIKPTAGLLTSRDFLNALAFRVFNSTQYIRHPASPFFTPEPDIVHELRGHAPMFANAEFAEISQQIGLASLGASDDDIEKLAATYWFAVEFGLIYDNKQEGKRKIFGASILSSFGEILNSMGKGEGNVRYEDFDPKIVEITQYPLTDYQPMYFTMPSFAEAKEQIKEYGLQMERHFHVSYNSDTCEIQIDSKELSAQVN